MASNPVLLQAFMQRIDVNKLVSLLMNLSGIDMTTMELSELEKKKQMLMQQMQASAGAIAAIKPSQANLDAVKPYMTQLAPLFAK